MPQLPTKAARRHRPAARFTAQRHVARSDIKQTWPLTTDPLSTVALYIEDVRDFRRVSKQSNSAFNRAARQNDFPLCWTRDSKPGNRSCFLSMKRFGKAATGGTLLVNVAQMKLEQSNSLPDNFLHASLLPTSCQSSETL